MLALTIALVLPEQIDVCRTPLSRQATPASLTALSSAHALRVARGRRGLKGPPALATSLLPNLPPDHGSGRSLPWPARKRRSPPPPIGSRFRRPIAAGLHRQRITIPPPADHAKAAAEASSCSVSAAAASVGFASTTEKTRTSGGAARRVRERLRIALCWPTFQVSSWLHETRHVR